jgi:hypothetical protein
VVGTNTESAVMVEGEDAGLVCNHAYSMQSVLEISDTEGNKHQLVRVRNPWGAKRNKEWIGRWCDDSEEMNLNYEIINQKIKEMDKNEAELIDLNQKRDGNFFMCFNDFVTIFSKLSICHKFPIEYNGYRFTSKWDQKTAGGTPYRNTPEQRERWLTNDQYLLTVSQETHIFISLGQEDGRLRASSEEIFPFPSSIHPAVLILLKSPNQKVVEFQPPEIVAQSPIKQFKEISINTTLQAGSYVIVPSTQDIGQQGPYFLSVYCPGDITLKNLTSGQQPEKIEEEDEKSMFTADPQVSMYLKFKAAETIFS